MFIFVHISKAWIQNSWTAVRCVLEHLMQGRSQKKNIWLRQCLWLNYLLGIFRVFMMSITATNIKNEKKNDWGKYLGLSVTRYGPALGADWSVAQAVAVENTITKPRTANVQRHRANAGCNSDQTISDYYKVNVLFPFVDHVVQQIDSRFSQRWQWALSIDNEHWHRWSNWNYKKSLTMKESSYFSVEVQKWKKNW